ncbi:MAG: hypothetical protein LPK49_12555, partial [Bacteroidota bacterium]|nr:hypothetical protein [Bacteroidota bacterium]MDX5431862.1 hypothetical protein [Bacteroidota bacterium]
KIYSLGHDGTWTHRDKFVWQGQNGHYYLQQDGQIYQSDDGSFWSLLSVDKYHSDILPQSYRVNTQ